MNLDLDLSVVTRFFRGILGELRQKRLWPVAVVLLAALVAVPLLLSKSSSPAAMAQTPLPTPPPSPATTLPTINEESTPAHSQLAGPAHDPFAGAAGASSSTASSSTTSSPASAVSTAVSTASSAARNAVSALSGGSSVSSNSSSGSGSGITTTTSSTAGGSTSSITGSSPSAPPSITGNAKPKPVPNGLTRTQSYDVALSITNSAGGVNSIDPLERLSVIPSEQQPLLVELGVLQGGKRVLFATQPDTVVYGPGSCIPGPVDCEILSLGLDQTEAVGRRVGGLAWSAEALFAVTGITATNYHSAAAAGKARRLVSAAGQALLASSNLPALSLFQYEPSLGSVVDLRNLTVGG